MDLSPELSLDKASLGALHLCAICQKPFLNESSYNRHVLYCRRARSRPRARLRSCQACIKSKRKCSGQLPCQRCTNKGAECLYTTSTPGNMTIEAAGTFGETGDKMAESTDHVTQAINAQAVNSKGQLFTPRGDEDAIDWDYLNFETSEMPLLGSSLVDSSLAYSQYESPESMMLNELPPPGSNTGIISTCPSTAASSKGLLLSEQASRGKDECAITGSRQSYSQLLCCISMKDPISNFTANIVMQTLCAFPQMMLRRETFPPFIHGHWHGTESDSAGSLPKPLVSCMGLAQVFASHNVDTRPFLWEKIREEQRSSADKVW